MGDRSQKLEGMALLLQGIIGRTNADNLDGFGFELEGLFHSRGENEFSCCTNGTPKRRFDSTLKVSG